MTRPRRDPQGRQADAVQHLDPVSLAVAISTLPPAHALVAAARAGVEVADARWEYREAQRQASKDVAAAALEQGAAAGPATSYRMRNSSDAAPKSLRSSGRNLATSSQRSTPSTNSGQAGPAKKARSR